MPIPTLADYIIPTSFPPSPIEHTILSNYNFNTNVTSDFYLGAHLQKTTDYFFIIYLKNY